ncbi:hypothetical protein SRABI35_00815 [Stenotrophomonas lactitubi]|nr:hypothetical protein SRABI35_00815 [Stenotrophomonas lactitubi]
MDKLRKGSNPPLDQLVVSMENANPKLPEGRKRPPPPPGPPRPPAGTGPNRRSQRG